MGAFEDAADKMAAEREAGLARSRELAARKVSVVDEFLAKVSEAGIKPIPLGIRGQQIVKHRGLIKRSAYIQDEYIEFKRGWVVYPGVHDRESDHWLIVVSTDSDLYGFPNRGHLWSRGPLDKWIGAPDGPFYAFERSSEAPQPKLYLHDSEADELVRSMVGYIESNS